MLAGIAMLALSTTLAQASGGGGNPVPLHSFFVCNVINGGDAGQVVDIGGAFIGPNRTGVTINFGALACAVTKLFNPNNSCQLLNGMPTACGTGEECLLPQGATEGTKGRCEIKPRPEPDPGGTSLAALKCYNVTASPRTSAVPGLQGPPSYLVEDKFFGLQDPSTKVGGEPGVQDGGIQYICGPANFTKESRPPK